MDIVKQLFALVVIFIIGFIYDKYKLHYDNEESKHYDVVRQYLMTEDSSCLAQSKKPILWIHTQYEKNSNHWASFGSRNTMQLNQPYKYITIKTIIDKCGGDFNICLIDDTTFANIIPGWEINMSLIADPIKENIRRLAIARILKTYGGMIVPDSMICMKSFIDIYNEGIGVDCDIFVGELMNCGVRGPSRNPNVNYPSTLFMGCKKDSSVMEEYVKYLEVLNSKDYTEESSFKGDDALWCMDMVQKGVMKLIPGKLLGAIDSYGYSMTLERLLGNSYVDIEPDVFGIYIPDKEILRRTKYQWFSRLSVGQALTSDTVIGKYLVLANSC